MSHKLQLTRRCLFSLPLAAAAAQPAVPTQTPAAAVAAALKELSFDAAQCWRVRDLSLIREDCKLYLTDVFLILSKPLDGQPVAALIWGEVEGGDAEVIILPPTAGERQSLARFTESPNLNEHFKSAILIFTDNTAAEILAFVRDSSVKPAAEMGALLADQFSPTLRNLTSSFETRIVQDTAGKIRPEYGLFFAALGGTPQGTFDVIYDPQSTDQIVVAKLDNRENRSYYNIWTSFPSRRIRKDPSLEPPIRAFQIEHVRIDASIRADLHLSATTTLRIRVPETSELWRVRNTLAFDISRRIRIGEVTVDGAPAQVLQRENLRSTLLRGSDNEVFLVALSNSLSPGEHTVVFQQEADVVIPAGNGVFFVNSRGTWYPHHGLQFATYELNFRSPKTLNVIATGDLIEERTEGDIRITKRRSLVPLRIAGFNLGEFRRSSASRGGLTVDIYANKAMEAGLTPRPIPVPLPVPTTGRQQRIPTLPAPMALPPPDPAGLIPTLAASVADAFEFLAARFGPPPLKTLAVSPIPGTFGQGFPGLIYLSTLAYLNARDRPQFANQGMLEVFFSEILVAHEVAHQWWGNTITTAGYRDEWMMESLANYSALLLLERKRGAKALEDVLDKYREHLLTNGINGQPIDSAGPIRFGARLDTSQTPEAYRYIVYEKGTWIIHMLRRRLGDAAFFNMLRELHTRFLRARVTTEDLRLLSAAHQPKANPDRNLEQLFSTYLDATGIPTLRLQTKQKRSPKGVALTLDLEQSAVHEDFAIDVPIELDFGRGKSETRWIRTDGPATSVEWTLPVAPLRVLLDPRNSLLALKR